MRGLHRTEGTAVVTFEFTDTDLELISALTEQGYRFVDVLLRSPDGCERIVKIVAPVLPPEQAQGRVET